MSHSQFHYIKSFILRHAWLNLLDKHMTTGRINQVTIIIKEMEQQKKFQSRHAQCVFLIFPSFVFRFFQCSVHLFVWLKFPLVVTFTTREFERVSFNIAKTKVAKCSMMYTLFNLFSKEIGMKMKHIHICFFRFRSLNLFSFKFATSFTNFLMPQWSNLYFFPPLCVCFCFLAEVGQIERKRMIQLHYKHCCEFETKKKKRNEHTYTLTCCVTSHPSFPFLWLTTLFRTRFMPIRNPYKPFQTLPFLETAQLRGMFGKTTARVVLKELRRNIVFMSWKTRNVIRIWGGKEFVCVKAIERKWKMNFIFRSMFFARFPFSFLSCFVSCHNGLDKFVLPFELNRNSIPNQMMCHSSSAKTWFLHGVNGTHTSSLCSRFIPTVPLPQFDLVSEMIR